MFFKVLLLRSAPQKGKIQTFMYSGKTMEAVASGELHCGVGKEKESKTERGGYLRCLVGSEDSHMQG